MKSLRTAYFATKKRTKKNISKHAKIRHYRANVRNAVVYAAETRQNITTRKIGENNVKEDNRYKKMR